MCILANNKLELYVFHVLVLEAELVQYRNISFFPENVSLYWVRTYFQGL